ncbi:MAG TPA: hypothetical protein VGP72_07450 [Planctomycetota bacterium]
MLWLPLLAMAGDAAELFRCEFSNAKVGTSAAELKLRVLSDAPDPFRVAEVGGVKALELNPNPADSYGLLFGPSESENVSVQVKFLASSSGRREPMFAVALSGVGGYMLRLNAPRKELELLKGDEVVKRVPFEWKSGTWTVLSLALIKVKDGAWKLLGKAWEQGKEEPKEALVSFDEKEKCPAGNAGAWGMPYSGEPIYFDELVVKSVHSHQ